MFSNCCPSNLLAINFPPFGLSGAINFLLSGFSGKEKKKYMKKEGFPGLFINC